MFVFSPSEDQPYFIRSYEPIRPPIRVVSKLLLVIELSGVLMWRLFSEVCLEQSMGKNLQQSIHLLNSWISVLVASVLTAGVIADRFQHTALSVQIVER